ncbi:MAG: NAD-dependent epimerase/dehydratase family protein [Flavobacteriales bacterium]|nr:NAD-dependent epimerase/dehydratase family protein [Flavobacteriales bacterium]
MKKNILITGATGFVGKHVLEEFSSQNVFALSSSVKAIDGVDEVFSWDELDKINRTFDAVIHLAGLAHDTQNKRDEQDYFDVNEGLTKKLLSHCTRWQVRTFIYLSSVKAVVDSTSDDVLDEDSKSTAKGVYGRSKLAAERAIEKSNFNGTKIILRPVMIYGKGQKGNLKALETIVNKGIPYPFGKWDNKRSVLYVKNLTFCIKKLIDNQGESGTYFISDDSPISTTQMLQYIGNGINKKPHLVSIPNGLIRFVRSISPNKVKNILDKVLGSLEVDNMKLLKALNWNKMPYETKESFEKTFRIN